MVKESGIPADRHSAGIAFYTIKKVSLMKTFVRIIALVALVALFSSCAFAESASFDELLAQRQEIDRQIIASEGFGPLPLAQGAFTVGVDLPAGTYRVESTVITAVVVHSGAQAEEDAVVLDQTVDQEHPIEELKLEEGNVLNVTGAQLSLTVIAIDEAPAGASYDELVAQRQALDEQLAASADFVKVKTAQATWTIGIDIPAGTYCTSNPPMCVVAVYNGDPHDDKNLVTMYTITAKEPIEKFELEEGLIFVVSSGFGEVEISSYTGLSF